jgi:hypothetical protein
MRKQKGVDGNARQPLDAVESQDGEQQWLQAPVLSWEF